MSARYPADLARHIHSQLAARREKVPAINVLEALFETMYFASLKHEESQPISCRIAFINRKRPDPKPPGTVVADRWQSHPLATDLPLTVDSLVKLSKAVDPWGSTLAVDATTDGQLRIWGLIDQSVHYSTFVVKEVREGPEMPGMFQAVIMGVGDVAVYKTYVLLGRLTQHVLVTKQHPVFESGPVYALLAKWFTAYRARVCQIVGKKLYKERGHWDASLEDFCVSALCRILIGIQRYGHGGAVLISDVERGLDPKYRLWYPRLSSALVGLAVNSIQHTAYSDKAWEEYVEKDATNIPVGLYLDESVSGSHQDDSENEVTGCIRFLTSLSRVDGLVWLDTELCLKGFGVEIVLRDDPSKVVIARNVLGTDRKALDLNHFGMRHRSMIRYCGANRNSIGFVVSQDGDVRAVMRVKDTVVVWENVRIHYLLNPRRR